MCAALTQGKNNNEFQNSLVSALQTGLFIFERAVAQPISAMKKDRYFYLPSFLYSVCILIIQKAVLSNQYFCP